jgi:uncharacterized iron-regulated membrane protein
MRALLVTLHRWFGLGAALFLFISGTTGALISWDHELDEWLNPELFQARSGGAQGLPLPTEDLVARIEQADPRVRVSFMPLAVEPGHTFVAFVQPRLNPATGRLHEPGYNQVALDPVTAEVQARREWGRVSLSRENLLPFLYKLHYTMHIPDGWGIELGLWFMGLLAIVWVFDTLIAVVISFPSAKQWRRSFVFRWRGGHRLTFDLHRSGAMWVYLLVLMLAATSVGMNLREPVMRPLVSWFSELSPSPFASRVPAPDTSPIEPHIELREAVTLARRLAHARGITAPPGGAFLSTAFGVWGVGFYAPGNSHGDGSLGNPWIYVDARTGEAAGADVPGSGRAGDLVMLSLFPLHAGRLLGVPGRILMSLMGAMVAMFSVTGVLIWIRKRRARRQQVAASAARPAPHLDVVPERRGTSSGPHAAVLCSAAKPRH